MLFGRILSYSPRAPMYMGPGLQLDQSVRTYSRMTFQHIKFEPDPKCKTPVQHDAEPTISSFGLFNLYTHHNGRIRQR
jgi:hypothetical protein